EVELPYHIRAGEYGGDRDHVRVTAPEHQGQILEDEREPHRGEHLAQLLSAETLEERVPLRDADQRDRESAHDHGGDEAAAAPDDCESNVAAEQIVGAVRHVHDAHDAEDEREAAGQEKEQGAVRDSVEELTDP